MAHAKSITQQSHCLSRFRFQMGLFFGIHKIDSGFSFVINEIEASNGATFDKLTFCGKTQQIEYNFESRASHDNANFAFKVFVFLYNNTRRSVRFKMQSTTVITDRRKKHNNSSLNAMCHKGKKKQEKNDFFFDWNSWCVLNEKALVTCTVTEKKKCDSYPRNCAELEPVSLYIEKCSCFPIEMVTIFPYFQFERF